MASATFDVDGTLLDANTSFLVFFGYSLEDVQGKHHSFFVSDASRNTDEYVASWKMLKAGEVVLGEGLYVGKEKKEIWLSAAHIPVLDEDGNTHRVIMHAVDVTSKKVQNVDLIGQVAAIGRMFAVATLAMDGTILDANDNCLNALGYRLEEIQGKQYNLIADKEFVSSLKYSKLWNRLNRGEFEIAEVKHICKGGKELYLKTSYNPILGLSGKPFKVLVLAVDPTKTSTRSAELERQKSLFLANMSHEIRTPMNGIFGMLELLKDVKMDTAGCTYVDTCLRSAESLLAVLNDILLYSKASAGTLELEEAPFNLNSLIDDVLHHVCSNVSPEQDIDVASYVKLDVPGFLIGDGPRLRVVLLNLLGNGVKFTRVGEVSLDVSVLTESPLLLRFDINDTGIGISQEHQTRLFAPFAPADPSTTRERGGTGLGLVICQHLVQLLGGNLSVQSQLGRGSTFSFTATFRIDPNFVDVPLSKGLNVEDDLSVLMGVHALIIDDNATNCMALEETLKYFGCSVISARSGVDGIGLMKAKKIRGENIDLCLLDQHMPRMSGMEVAHEVANLGFTPKIIVLTSNFDGKLTLEPNVSAVCAKPIRRGQLLHMIVNLLSSPAKKHDPTETVSKQESSALLPETQFHGTNVLVVEDNDTNRKVLKLLLTRASCHVIEAVNGVEGVEHATSDIIDVVFMDVHMPVMDGIAATKLILQKRPDLPIVFLTADTTEETRLLCQEVGATRFLVKPVNKGLLFEALFEVLRDGHRVTRESIHCMIVDADKPSQAILCAVLKKYFGQNMAISFARSGEEALQAVSKLRCPDLILMDVMPDIGGIEATRAIRQLQLSHPVAIIGVKGVNDAKSLQKCMDAGMDLVLTKPVREVDLKALIPLLKSKAWPNDVCLIDKSFLEDIDADVRDALLDEWRSTVIVQLKQLKERVANLDWKAVEGVAHSINGSASQLGATQVSHTARTMETFARTGAPDVAELKKYMEELCRITSLSFQEFGMMPIGADEK